MRGSRPPTIESIGPSCETRGPPWRGSQLAMFRSIPVLRYICCVRRLHSIGLLFYIALLGLGPPRGGCSDLLGTVSVDRRISSSNGRDIIHLINLSKIGTPRYTRYWDCGTWFTSTAPLYPVPRYIPSAERIILSRRIRTPSDIPPALICAPLICRNPHRRYWVWHQGAPHLHLGDPHSLVVWHF